MQHQMSTTAARLKLTYDDYLLFPEDGRRHELVDGEHRVTPAPDTRHQLLSFRLSGRLFEYLSAHPVGQALAAPCDVKLSETDVVQPDVLFVSRERSGIVRQAAIDGPPDLVVEILSASTRRMDEQLKRNLYAKHGVAEYWIVDPDLETVRVWRRGTPGFELVRELAAERGEAVTTPLLPGLRIDLASLFG
jgi:Uma2 family endonuclease